MNIIQAIKPVFHTGIKVDQPDTASNRYCLYWVDDDGQNASYIVSVFGFENAVRVANGIGHEQTEYVTHCMPPS
jgi:hypothetical protein